MDVVNEFLNKGIKDIMQQFPEVEKVLEEYEIGCAPCNVGTCLLKDIVEIHNLSPEREKELMLRIAKIIYPDREIEIPEIKRKSKAQAKGLQYSPPMQKLVDEHKLIKRLVALIPEIAETLDVEFDEGQKVIRDSVDFIRNFADKYHHAKEEDILFKYFDEDLDILKVIHQDHETGRSHVKAILEGLDEKNKDKVREHLLGYAELLTEHIKKEDEILYPWMDRNFSMTQVGDLFTKFNKVDEEFGEIPKHYEKFIFDVEEKYMVKNL